MTLEAKIENRNYTILPGKTEIINQPPYYIVLRGNKIGGKILIVDPINPEGIGATLSKDTTLEYHNSTLDIYVRGR